MGTRNNPSKFDCIAKAEDDEPLFTLLGRDPQGASLVQMWIMLRNKDAQGARRLLEKMIVVADQQPYKPSNADKVIEAIGCAEHMQHFYKWRQELGQ